MQTISKIRLVISQPNVRTAPSEWDFPNDEMVTISAENCLKKGRAALDLIGKPIDTISEYLTPGEKQCAYCRAKAECPKLTALVSETTALDFDAPPEEASTLDPTDNASLGKAYLLLPLIGKWVKAVEEKVYRLALAGEIGEAEGIKVVAGRRGNKAWDNPEAIEALMKEMRFKHEQMYTSKLVTPTKAEELIAEANPRKWKKLVDHITQAEGSPVVVSLDDNRQALNVKPENDFDVVGQSTDDLL